MHPVAAALLLTAAVCAACTHSAPSTGAAPSNAASCFIADNLAPTPDTLFVIDPRPVSINSDALTCDGVRTLSSDARAPHIVYARPAPGTDLRDVLDHGLANPPGHLPDVLVTHDPNVLAYAQTTNRYSAYALPWARTYVLAVPGADSLATIPVAARNSLAQDAVSVDARGAAGPFWWASDTACVQSSAVTTRHSHTIAYAAGDDIARQLAERIAALAGSANAPAWLPVPLAEPEAHSERIVAVRPDSLPAVLHDGSVAAAVYSYSLIPPDVCTSRAPIPGAGALLPLIDTRPHVLVRNGSGAAFYVTRSGELWFTRGSVR